MLTVTKLEQQKKHPGRVNVYLDGEFAFGISREFVPWLEEGQQLSQQRVAELQAQDRIEAAYQRALHYLSYRSRSEKEVRLNLQKHHIPEDQIELVLDRLRQASLVDDRAFAREWVENRIRFKPRGRKALASELYHKGIQDRTITEVLGDLDEEDLALQFARQKLPKLRHLDHAKFQEKLYGLLSRRGFSFEISQGIISTLWEELEG